LSVSEYVTINVKSKPVTFLHGTNQSWLYCGLSRAGVIISLLQENNLSNSTPHMVKCRTGAVEHLFAVCRNLKKAKNYFIEAKFIN